jgi:hypothetical protein
MRWIKLWENFKNEEKKFEIDLEVINSGDKRGWDAVNNILTKSNITLDNCLEFISFHLIEKEIAYFDTKFELIGSGQYGIAFKFRDKIVKITTSEKEYNTSLKLVGKELEGVVKYHLTFQFFELPIWISVQDKLETLSKKERDIYTTLYYLGANDIQSPNFKYSDLDELFKALDNRLRNPDPEDELPPYVLEKEELRKYFRKYFSLVKFLDENGISTDDLHGENIGLRNDKLTHFDVMII